MNRAATAKTQITNTILGAASVAVALRATSAGPGNVMLSTGKRLQLTRSNVRIQ
jgi:hypothetical protein